MFVNNLYGEKSARRRRRTTCELHCFKQQAIVCGRRAAACEVNSHYDCQSLLGSAGISARTLK